jgi:hypothetical protein
MMLFCACSGDEESSAKPQSAKTATIAGPKNEFFRLASQEWAEELKVVVNILPPGT